MTWAVGNTVSFIATFRNADNSVATGLTVTAVSMDAFDRTTGAVIAFPALSSFAEIGATGRYRATAAPVTAGRYTVVAHAAGVPDYEIVEDVLTAQQLDPMASARGAKLDSLGAASVTVQSPVTAGGDVPIYQGDDYRARSSRSIPWKFVNYPDLAGSTLTLIIRSSAGTLVVTPTSSRIDESTQVVTAELTATQTASLAPSPVVTTYDLSALLTIGDERTLARGRVIVTADVAAAS